jgi:hypothetical protein
MAQIETNCLPAARGFGEQKVAALHTKARKRRRKEGTDRNMGKPAIAVAPAISALLNGAAASEHYRCRQ